jgi:hypothetical protein
MRRSLTQVAIGTWASSHALLRVYQEMRSGSVVRYAGNESTPIMGVGTLVFGSTQGAHEAMRVPDVRLVQTVYNN